MKRELCFFEFSQVLQRILAESGNSFFLAADADAAVRAGASVVHAQRLDASST